jgi:DNA-binding HxlR family transcriptional regulator
VLISSYGRVQSVMITERVISRRKTTPSVRPSVCDCDCPSRLILDHLADKWAVLIVVRLASGTMRFAELRRAIGGISQKMLTVTLRDLERDGLVSRKLYASVPPKVEYSLTSLGSSLVDKVNELCAWAEANTVEILKARERFDRRNSQLLRGNDK